MNRVVGFAYAGARLQARYGRLVPGPTWDRLRRLDTRSGFLQAARDTALQGWIAQLDPAAEAHAVEAQLRALFRRRVAEVAAWSPPPWRPAVAWVGVLPDVPAIAARRRGADAGWLPADTGALADGPAPGEAWLARWRALWPEAPAAQRRALERLLALLRKAATDAARDAPAAQAALERPLQRLFRRHTRAPAGLFAYLALAWVEFAQLRGALLRRRLALPLEGSAT